MPGVLEYLDAQIDLIKKHTAAALEAFDEKGVHQARVGTRRLKAGLDLLDPLLDKSARPIGRIGKQLRRRLGPLRDLDVMIGHVAALPTAGRLGPAVEWLAKHLDHARRDARLDDQKHGKSPYKLLAKLENWPAVRQSIEAAPDAITPLLTQALHTQFADFRDEADWVSKLKTPPEDHGPINVHNVRINGKALRYTLEIADAHGAPVADRIFKAFKALQESLGTWHDFVVLAEETMEFVLDHELPLHDPELAAGVLDLVKLFLRQSNTALNQFRAQWKRSGVDLAAALHAYAPLIETPETAADAEPEVTLKSDGETDGEPDEETESTPEPESAETAETDPSGPVDEGTISTGAT